MEGFEVLTMDDKSQRDNLFDQLRHGDDHLERKAVKFSGSRPTGTLDHTGKRLAHVSTWSVAYPRS